MFDNIFAQGTLEEIRFVLPEGSMPSGELTIEQLWKLQPVTKMVGGQRRKFDYLKDYEVELEEQVEKFGKKSRRDRDANTSTGKTKEQEDTELRLAIVSFILDHKAKESKEAEAQLAKREHNSKVRAAIAKKKEDAFENLSMEELEKLIQS